MKNSQTRVLIDSYVLIFQNECSTAYTKLLRTSFIDYSPEMRTS